ncbi:hypothetical protein ACPPVO_16450 [Dactylosporangium sp. McL0621]
MSSVLIIDDDEPLEHKRLLPDPSRPRYFVTEPGIGYRLQLTP